MRNGVAIVWLALLLLPGCGPADKAARRPITMWHFWSEPAQRNALETLIEQFEREYPDLDVQLTALQWSDGKAKLMAAWNAGAAPDVVHLGLDWFADFDAGGAFADLPDSLATDGRACRWLVNARALVIQDAAPQDAVGLCATDAHNVIKRTLPLLWQLGAPQFYARQPVAATMDSALVEALWRLRTEIVPTAVIDRSRQLDERLMRGEIRRVFSGAWLVDAARARNVRTLRVEPVRSILNADVLAVSRTSAAQGDAHALIAFLRDYRQARAFCAQVSDAGFPADVQRAMGDTLFTADAFRAGFAQTALLSAPLPAGPVMLQIEPIIEDMIVRSYDADSRDAIATLVASARAKIEQVSSGRK